MPLEALHLARGQFAMTAIFHILWPILTISLSAFLLVVEILWVRTSEVVWYRHARFWSKLLVLNFAVGVVSGIPMEFQFGTNWRRFRGSPASSSATSSASKARWPSCLRRASSAS